MNRSFTVLALGLLAAVPHMAQAQTPPMPGMTMPTKTAPDPKMGHQRSTDTTMPGMSMPGMSSSVDLNDPMSQEASGTAWLPASSPMYGKMVMGRNGDMLMLHGAVMPRYTDIGSKRGDRRFDSYSGRLSYNPDANDALQVSSRALTRAWASP